MVYVLVAIVLFLCIMLVVCSEKRYMRVAGALLGLITIAIYVNVIYTEEQNIVEPQQVDVLKTVAHIDLSNRHDLELISADYDNDIAYYRYVDPNYNVTIGETVLLVDNTEAILVSVDAVGFTIEVDGGNLTGLSGTAVRANDTQIGYISKRLSDGTIRCVWS